MTKRRKPVFLMVVLVLAILLAAALVYVNYTIRDVFGLPGKILSPISTLKQSLVLFQGKEKLLAVAPGNGVLEEKVTIEPDNG